MNLGYLTARTHPPAPQEPSRIPDHTLPPLLFLLDLCMRRSQPAASWHSLPITVTASDIRPRAHTAFPHPATHTCIPAPLTHLLT